MIYSLKFPSVARLGGFFVYEQAKHYTESQVCLWSKGYRYKADKLALIEIPLHYPSRQHEIAFLTLDAMSSLKDKLKEEIEMRKKQYEYYREALLSF